jgi:hypothetical protein
VVAVEAETDGTLIERSCRGRPDAFVEVVRRHLWIVQGIFAASGLFLLTPRIRAARDLTT